MGIVKGIMIFLLNMAIFVVAIRFVSLLLERAGVFKFMERLFGKGSDVKTDVIEADDVQINDIDNEKEQE
jgi:hypothetical protein